MSILALVQMNIFEENTSGHRSKASEPVLGKENKTKHFGRV